MVESGKICTIDYVIEIDVPSNSDRKLSAEYKASGWSSTSLSPALLGH